MMPLIVASLIGTVYAPIQRDLDPLGSTKQRRECEALLKEVKDLIQAGKDRDILAAQQDKWLAERHEKVNRMLKSAGLPSLEDRELERKKKNDKP